MTLEITIGKKDGKHAEEETFYLECCHDFIEMLEVLFNKNIAANLDYVEIRNDHNDQLYIFSKQINTENPNTRTCYKVFRIDKDPTR